MELKRSHVETSPEALDAFHRAPHQAPEAPDAVLQVEGIEREYLQVEYAGGDVLYVANRCILCTRCVRFMDDVHEDAVLAVGERGDRAVITTAPDAGLTQAWAGNVVDLCPVGALLSKDFLNKARAWELDRSASDRKSVV